MTALPDFVAIERRSVKHVRIEVKSAHLVKLIIPRHLSLADAVSFYTKHQQWVEQHRAQCIESERYDFGLSVDQWLLHGQGVAPRSRADDQALWYRRYAKLYLSNRLEELCYHYDFKINKCTIRDQKTRWGSCSSAGNISLNWRLILMPEWVSDYILLHELCHTRFMDHSSSFWAEVEKYHSDIAAAKSWLKHAGDAVMKY